MNDRERSRARGPVVVFGAAGQLGRVICRTFERHETVVPFAHADLDVTDGVLVRRRLEEIRPALIVNCAAYNQVDAAEAEAQTALAVNALAVRSMARAARDLEAVFVHYGTDFVFDGETDRPYTEEDAPRPLGVYAASKLMGEWFAAAPPVHYVLRVESLFGGEYRLRSSIDRIADAIAAGEAPRVFTDRVCSPSYVADVAEATCALVERGAPPGVYHCVNSGFATWQEIAREIATRLGREDAPIVPVRMADVPLRAPRPRFAALSNGKLAQVGIAMPAWEHAIGRYVDARRGRASGE